MCRGMGFVRHDVPVGHPDFGKPFPCPHSVHNSGRLERVAKLSGLSEQDARRRLTDIKPNGKNQEMLEAAREMVTNPYGWLYIHGGPGNAKSEVLIALVNELSQAGHICLYTTFSKVVDWMRDAYGEKKKRQEGDDVDLGYIARFERIKGIKVLAIDEFDKARMTEFAEEFRFGLLDDRYRQAVNGETVTIFASNTAPDDLPGPIYDRVRDGRFRTVHNTAGSARPYMKR